MPEQQEQDAEQSDPNPNLLYNCAVCREFSCDHLQALSDHLAVDRTKLRETEVSIHIGGTYICKLCSYKTNLKANFQLHCKTDKHLQKLQLVNHIMEGGPSNEWKLNFMNVSNSVQLRCNACDFYTDSIHKLQIHSANQGHEVSSAIFSHLRKEEQVVKGERLEYTCTICKHGAGGKALLLQHCRSVKHLQMEQLHLLQLRAEGGGQSPEIGDIFTVSAVASEAEGQEGQEQESKGTAILLESRPAVPPVTGRCRRAALPARQQAAFCAAGAGAVKCAGT
jgi:AT-binding transcription factor 1